MSAAGPLARIQEDQSQRSVTADHLPEIAAGHQPGLVAGPFKRERAVLSVLVIAAVPNEVQYVVFPEAQWSLQGC